MKNLVRISLIIISLCGYTSFPASVSSKPRTITLEGTVYNEETSGKFISWECRDYFTQEKNSFTQEKILVEVGTFTAPKLTNYGFVLYDGGNSGNITNYQRKGINLRWDWGPNGNDFSFIIKPDGTGLFYDFSNAKFETIKAEQIFKCRQR